MMAAAETPYANLRKVIRYPQLVDQKSRKRGRHV